mgnify:CR=1 FL=1
MLFNHYQTSCLNFRVVFSSLARLGLIPLLGCASIGLLEGQTPITDVNSTPVPERRSALLSELFDKPPSVADGLLESNASRVEQAAGAVVPPPKSAPSFAAYLQASDPDSCSAGGGTGQGSACWGAGIGRGGRSAFRGTGHGVRKQDPIRY